MNNFAYQLYRVLVPKPIRKNLLLNKLQIKITNQLNDLPIVELSSEKKAVLDYITKNGVSVFPYEFTQNYIKSSIKVYRDKDKGLKYVFHENKKLYFKKRWSVSRIQRAYNQLLMEQDVKSPHCYLNQNFKVDATDVVVDFGAAEGNFSLSVVEKVSHIYIFEADYEWIDALNATFEPWKEKITIVPKFVTNFDDTKHCTGDNYFDDKKVSFLKIDVEGSESKLLEGTKNILRKSAPLKIALCTYHKQNDEEEFTQLLKQNGFNVEASQGYVIFYLDKKIKSPYLRRALLRAYK